MNNYFIKFFTQLERIVCFLIPLEYGEMMVIRF